MTFTAAQISAPLGISPQAVRKLLRGNAGTASIVRGVTTQTWALAQLPAPLLARLDVERAKQNCRTVEDLLTMPRRRYQPATPLDKIHDDDIQEAIQKRKALEPWLARRHDASLSSAEMESRGVEDYRRILGHAISTRGWRELFNRTVQRDNGFEEWGRLELYISERAKLKAVSPDTVFQALADDFSELEAHLGTLQNPAGPSGFELEGLWAVIMRKFGEQVRAGASEKSAARRLRHFLFARAKFLAPTPNALRMKFERRLAVWQPEDADCLADGRKCNGDRADYPSKDIRRVRHSAALNSSGRIDEAWREQYPQLSDYTQNRHPKSRRCPPAFYRLVNREKVDALVARLKGNRKLRQLIGGVKRQTNGIPAMAVWTADDWTSNIVVLDTKADGTLATDADGAFALTQPQIITVMDFASRKWVGWAIANVKAPNAELVCAAVLDGFRRHGVPRKLRLENGLVFGKSLNVNGRVDEAGRTVVAGLAKYGCTIGHFDKMSPTSKGELEKSFDLIQRRMERWPGYAGRLQMLDASDDFKKEQRLIQSGKLDAEQAKKFRMTYDEFARVLMPKLIEEYNSEPQHGHLNGLSPNEAFEALRDPTDPPIKFDNQLEWLLTNEHYRVTVQAGGVNFRHYGREIQVRGGELVEHVGEELWALVDRQDESMVTFMSLDYRAVFTIEICRQPSADEPKIVSGTSILAAELRKVGQHMRAVGDELTGLTAEFGNPRTDLLAQLRREVKAPAAQDETTRRTIINGRLNAAAAQMEVQRDAQTARRKQGEATKARARRMGIPAALVDNDEQSRRALELLGDCRAPAPRSETPEPSDLP